MRITVVAGCRPEFVKLAPVVAELRRRGESPTIIATGQHTDLLRGTPFEDGMAPDLDLGLRGSNDPLAYARVCENTLRPILEQQNPDLMIVQGDTASAYAGAMAASGRYPVVHIEAGIRSHDDTDPWPEEIFRREIDNIASENRGWKFAPTDHAKCNLLDWWNTETTGNPGIDALYSHTKPVEQSQKVDRVLITLHRRESFGEPLQQIVAGIVEAVKQHPSLEFMWPTHPNPRVQEAVPDDITLWRNLIISPPARTDLFAKLLCKARVVITDSGGVQEEAAALGIPAVIAREKTDRPESVELGLARVVGRSEQGILQGLQWALDVRCEPSDCFGDGVAAPRIVEHLLNWTKQNWAEQVREWLE